MASLPVLVEQTKLGLLCWQSKLSINTANGGQAFNTLTQGYLVASNV